MKAASIFVFSYCAVMLYFIFLNATPFAWFPFVFILFVLFYHSSHYAHGWLMAVIMGLLLDIHFQFIGPYLGIFVLTMVVIKWTHDHTSSWQSLPAALIVMGAASIWYILALFTVSGLINGFQHYYAGPGTVYALISMVIVTWFALVIGVIGIRSMRKALGYAR